MKALKVNGIFNQETKKRLQKWLDVSQDGKIGEKTIKALQKKVGAKVDGKWGKNTTTHLQKFLNKNGASLKVDGAFGKESKKALQRFLNEVYHLDPDQNPKANAAKIADKAKELAWPEGTKKSKYGYPDGSATPAFKKAIDRAYPNRSKWGKQTRAGASCDVFVGTVIRDTDYDKSFPRGLDEVKKHVKGNDKWELTGVKSESKMKKGDIIYQEYKGGGGHISVYLGNGKIANAHYNGKTFGRIQKFSSLQPASKCSVYNVYRTTK